MANAYTAVYLVEQGWAQVGELTLGDDRFGGQAIVGEQLGQVQALEKTTAVNHYETTGCDIKLFTKYSVLTPNALNMT